MWKKVEEEIEELKEELKNNNRERIEQEFGDTLFALINYSRFIDVNPEFALERTNKKFINRFQYIEEKVLQQGKDLRKMTLKEMDVFWNEAKKQE